MKVLHGGSVRAADRMNRDQNPVYEMSCEINAPLSGYTNIELLRTAQSISLEFAIYGLYGGGEGFNYRDGFSANAEPDTIAAFTEAHPPDQSSKVSFAIKPGEQSLGSTTGEKTMWWLANLDLDKGVFRLRSILNGWGECRWKDHCYAHINIVTLGVTPTVCKESGTLLHRDFPIRESDIDIHQSACEQNNALTAQCASAQTIYRCESNCDRPTLRTYTCKCA